jgi:hypothetical protein
MAAKTFYLKDATAGTGPHRSLQDGGVAPTAATTGTGWTVGKTASGNYSLQFANVERAANTFGGTALPSASIDTANGDCWRSENTISGRFAAASAWTVTLQLRSVTAAATGSVRIHFRLYKGANQDGSGATQITSLAVAGGVTGALSTSADKASSNTFTPPADVVFDNEYLFVQIALSIVTASGGNTQDALIRVGSTATVVTGDFQPNAVGSAAGTSDAQGVGRGIAAAVGSAAGAGSASAVAPAPWTRQVGSVYLNEYSERQAQVPGGSFVIDDSPAISGGPSTESGVGSATGTGTATGVGASTAASVGDNAAGVGTATGVGASTAASVGDNAAGVGTATGVGAALYDGVGAAAGTSTATGVGESIAASVGDNASGTGAATGVGASTAASAGDNAAGVGTATGVGAADAASVGAAIGSSDVLGIASAIAAAAGSAAGSSTALGVSPPTAYGFRSLALLPLGICVPTTTGTWKSTVGLTVANTKTVNGLAKASIKSFLGLTP